MTTKTEKLTKEQQAEEYRKRAESDFDPTETARQRYERLQKEMAEVRATVQAEEQKGTNTELRPLVDEFVKKLESITGLTCRNLTVRYHQPGSGDVPLVSQMEQGEPGVVIKFRVVKPRQKDN